MTMTMALLIVDDDDVEENDHHAGSTNAPQIPIKSNGPSLSLLPHEAYSPQTQLRPNLNASPHMARQFYYSTTQYNTK